MTHRRLIALCAVLFALTGSVAQAGDWPGYDWHGSGWLGTAWGRTDGWYGFRRDPIVGVYGARAIEHDPYASYRNDNGCARVLPVVTPRGIQRRRVFVCDF
ncbi:MAG: hypothetical protein ABW213_04090 [Tardiphaga sp.]